MELLTVTMILDDKRGGNIQTVTKTIASTSLRKSPMYFVILVKPEHKCRNDYIYKNKSDEVVSNTCFFFPVSRK